MRLLLIRHAQSMNNAHEDNPAYEHRVDVELTPTGHQQANHLAAFFRQQVESEEMQKDLADDPTYPLYNVEQLLVSPMRRTLQTVKPLAEAVNLAPTVLADAYERGGAYKREGTKDEPVFVGHPGLNREQMKAIVPNVVMPDAITDNGWWNKDGGEPLDAYVARGQRVVRYLKQQAQGEWADQWVVLVTHADFTNLLLKMLIFGEDNITDPYTTGFFAAYNTGVTRLYIDPENGFPFLLSFSRVDHLPYHLVTR